MTNRLRPEHFVLTIGIALVLGACSSGSTPGASSGPVGPSRAPGAPAAIGTTPAAAATTNVVAPTAAAAVVGSTDACALVTDAEVVAAFGESMLPAVSSDDHGDSTCNWMHETGGLDLTISISSKPSSAAVITSMQAAYGPDSAVTGVGDAALEFGGILQFVKGTTLVTIGTGDGPGIISPANFKALAVSAAGRV